MFGSMSEPGRGGAALPAAASTSAGSLALALVPVGALALVVAVDAVARSREWPVLVVGLLDEPAHLATAVIFLAAFLPRRALALLPWALAASVLIDLDHVPLYLRGVLADANGGRPVTHSLTTVAVLLAAGAAFSRLRSPLVGLALGVVLHLVRDLATGPGLSPLWPVNPAAVRLPYVAYLVPLSLVAALATVRPLISRRADRSHHRS
jgi:inner membrane protein